MTRRVRKILAAGDARGDVGKLKQLMDQVDRTEADAVALVGDLTGQGSETDDFRAVFKSLGSKRVTTYWVPGPGDAPFANYLRESSNIETVYPFLHGVHGTASLAPGYVLFAGMGGEIVDDPHTEHNEVDALRYPGWEAEYRLKVVGEFTHEYDKVFMFATPPAHKGLHEPGSEVLAELIKTHDPRVALVAGGDRARTERLGNTLVVLPGSLPLGHYAVVDIQNRSAEPAMLA
jgi:uncharacterized protein